MLMIMPKMAGSKVTEKGMSEVDWDFSCCCWDITLKNPRARALDAAPIKMRRILPSFPT